MGDLESVIWRFWLVRNQKRLLNLSDWWLGLSVGNHARRNIFQQFISGRTPNSILIPIFPLKKYVPTVGQKHLEVYTCTEESYWFQLIRWLKWRYNVLIPFYQRKFMAFSPKHPTWVAPTFGKPHAKTQEIHMCGTPVMTWMGLERMSTWRFLAVWWLDSWGKYINFLSLLQGILKWIYVMQFKKSEKSW